MKRFFLFFFFILKKNWVFLCLKTATTRYLVIITFCLLLQWGCDVFGQLLQSSWIVRLLYVIPALLFVFVLLMDDPTSLSPLVINQVMPWMVPCEWLKTMKPTHKLLLFVLCLVLGFICYSYGKLHLQVWGQKPRKWHLQFDCIIYLSPDHPSVFIEPVCETSVSVFSVRLSVLTASHLSVYFSVCLFFQFCFIVSMLNPYRADIKLCVGVTKPACAVLNEFFFHLTDHRMLLGEYN